MLVLTRKTNESVVLRVPASTAPTEIVVLLVEVQKTKCRIGFAAPLEVTVARSELPAGGRFIKTG
jgi:carbon storage regulator CsrA